MVFAFAGMTGANMSMIYAIISSYFKDKDTENLTRAFSFVSALTGLCFILGPQISNFGS